jgi:hypothetical protein
VISPWPYLLAVILFAAGGFGGWRAAMDHRDALELADARGRADALEAVAVELSKIKVVQKTNNITLEREIVEKRIYQDCKHSPEALKALNSALAVQGRRGNPFITHCAIKRCSRFLY